MPFILESLIFILLSAVFTLVFSFLGRMHGGGDPELPIQNPRTYQRIFYAITNTIDNLSLETWLLSSPLLLLCTLNIYLGVGAFFLSVLGWRKGHGQYYVFPYNYHILDNGTEDLDFLLKPFFGSDPRLPKYNPEIDKVAVRNRIKAYGKKKLMWRNFFGMWILGFLQRGIAGVAAMFFGGFIPGFILILSTVINPLAYKITQMNFNTGTEKSEYVRGAFVGLAYILLGVSLWIT